MIFPVIFLIFSKFWFFWFLSCGKSKKIKNNPKLPISFLRNCRSLIKIFDTQCKVRGVFLCFLFKIQHVNIKILAFFIGPLQQFFNKQLFFKFIDKCHKEIKIPNTLLQTLVSSICVRGSAKILNSMVVEARQSFQFFRQKAWFLENNGALATFLYEILHYLISIIKS